jgi:hypothetical protein
MKQWYLKEESKRGELPDGWRTIAICSFPLIIFTPDEINHAIGRD